MRLFARLLCLALVAPVCASATEFWLAGRDPVQQEAAHKPTPTDYMQLFDPAAPWRSSAARLSVFEIFPLMVLRGSDDLLRTVFQEIRRRHIAMAIEIGAIADTELGCGGGEGYVQPGVLDRLGHRLKALSLTLDYVALDEPLWFGHERYWGRTRQGRPDCRYPVSVVAERVAASIRSLQTYFPSIRAGDIEVVSNRVDPRQLVADYAEFVRRVQVISGQKLAFFHADIAWQDDWRPIVAPLAATMRQAGIRFGIIAGGSVENASDEEWTAVGLRRLRELAANPATRPDDVVIQSWQALPDRMLPETLPGSSTYLLNQAEDLVP